eukprot:scaffold156745_cov32-Tisochrysis_lutea.AAC.1
MAMLVTFCRLDCPGVWPSSCASSSVNRQATRCRKSFALGDRTPYTSPCSTLLAIPRLALWLFAPWSPN